MLYRDLTHRVMYNDVISGGSICVCVCVCTHTHTHTHTKEAVSLYYTLASGVQKSLKYGMGVFQILLLCASVIKLTVNCSLF
jgi:hypothetical protein